MGISVKWYNKERVAIAETIYAMDEGEYIAVPEDVDTFTFFHVDIPPGTPINVTGSGNLTLPPRGAGN